MNVEGIAGPPGRGVARYEPAPENAAQCSYECIHGSRCYREAAHPEVCETNCSEFGIVRFNGLRIWASRTAEPVVCQCRPGAAPK